MEKTILWLPLVKAFDGNYRGILSDNSIDRDNEIISEELLKKWAKDPNKYIPALADHLNVCENLVAKWVKPEIIRMTIDGKIHTALSVTPEFFLANPKAQMIKGMLDEGAEFGLSIGAIPQEKTNKTINGKNITIWTEAELIEGSFTPIPSNRHSFIKIAKNFCPINKEEKKMENERTDDVEKLKSEIEKLKQKLKQKEDEEEKRKQKQKQDEDEEEKKKSFELNELLLGLTKKIENLEKKDEEELSANAKRKIELKAVQETVQPTQEKIIKGVDLFSMLSASYGKIDLI